MCPSAPDFWLDNNYNSNTAVVKQDFAVGNQVDGRAAHMIDRHNSAPELAEHPPHTVPPHCAPYPPVPLGKLLKLEYLKCHFLHFRRMYRF
jgi:hypothetical protein